MRLQSPTRLEKCRGAWRAPPTCKPSLAHLCRHAEEPKQLADEASRFHLGRQRQHSAVICSGALLFSSRVLRPSLVTLCSPLCCRLITGRYVLRVLYGENRPKSENWANLMPRSSATVRHREKMTDLRNSVALVLQRGVNRHIA